jgi:hypothetical protein
MTVAITWLYFIVLVVVVVTINLLFGNCGFSFCYRCFWTAAGGAAARTTAITYSKAIQTTHGRQEGMGQWCATTKSACGNWIFILTHQWMKLVRQIQVFAVILCKLKTFSTVEPFWQPQW